MTKKLIVYPDAEQEDETRHAKQFDRIRQLTDFEIYLGRPTSDQEYIERIQQANGVLLGWDLPGRIMVQALNLEAISFTGIGADKFIDLDQAKQRNIVVSNCPGYSNITVAEHTIGLLLALAKQITSSHDNTKNGQWNTDLTATELYGKTIGLIGFGGIGQHVTKLCLALGMKVKVWTPSMNPSYPGQFGIQLCPLDELYQSAPFISVHLASNAQTNGLIDNKAVWFDASWHRLYQHRAGRTCG